MVFSRFHRRQSGDCDPRRRSQRLRRTTIFLLWEHYGQQGVILVFAFLFSASLRAQIITTFAGNGTSGNPTDGDTAATTSIGYPDGCIFDRKGNFYFTQVYLKNNILQ